MTTQAIKSCAFKFSITAMEFIFEGFLTIMYNNSNEDLKVPCRKADCKITNCKPNQFKSDQTLDDYLMMPNILLFQGIKQSALPNVRIKTSRCSIVFSSGGAQCLFEIRFYPG